MVVDDDFGVPCFEREDQAEAGRLCMSKNRRAPSS
jgi:hypothetical protein